MVHTTTNKNLIRAKVVQCCGVANYYRDGNLLCPIKVHSVSVCFTFCTVSRFEYPYDLVFIYSEQCGRRFILFRLHELVHSQIIVTCCLFFARGKVGRSYPMAEFNLRSHLYYCHVFSWPVVDCPVKQGYQT